MEWEEDEREGAMLMLELEDDEVGEEKKAEREIEEEDGEKVAE